jgi:hypothetical protein
MAITNPDLTRVLVTVDRKTLATLDAWIEKANSAELKRREEGKAPKPIVKRDHVLRSAIERAAKDVGRKR